MTELEVLYKLERAYSRKWWQFWIEPFISISINKPFRTSVYQALSREYQLEYFSFHSKTLHYRIMELLGGSCYDKWQRLDAIRSAIAKLTEQN